MEAIDVLYASVLDHEHAERLKRRPVFDAHAWRRWFAHYAGASDGAALRAMRRIVGAGTVHVCEAGAYRVASGERVVIGTPHELDAHAERCVHFDAGAHGDVVLPDASPRYATRYSVVGADCVVAALHLADSGLRPCVLNMASEQQPGGGWHNGAGAQEENLFRRTTYHRVLRRHDVRGRLAYPLPEFGGVYAPTVLVFRSSEDTGYQFLPRPRELAFVAVAAYRRPALLDAPPGHEPRLAPAAFAGLQRKMRALLAAVARHGHDAVVLSALGCGAFRNPPRHVAEAFREVLLEPAFVGRFRHVVFAIFDDHNAHQAHNPDGNLRPFAEVFADLHEDLPIASEPEPQPLPRKLGGTASRKAQPLPDTNDE